MPNAAIAGTAVTVSYRALRGSTALSEHGDRLPVVFLTCSMLAQGGGGASKSLVVQCACCPLTSALPSPYFSSRLEPLASGFVCCAVQRTASITSPSGTQISLDYINNQNALTDGTLEMMLARRRPRMGPEDIRNRDDFEFLTEFQLECADAEGAPVVCPDGEDSAVGMTRALQDERGSVRGIDYRESEAVLMAYEPVHYHSGGVVWCGVVWCGVVWCGVVWCGVV